MCGVVRACARCGAYVREVWCVRVCVCVVEDVWCVVCDVCVLTPETVCG